ncbi:MAG: MarR family transcriptional regulator [Oscillospiraceae bacterium]|jgi:DNA-binding MarR family transcriptional regulator|nr:MarR family transcriptional regulator [Oscillospiraceae bacterium]
MEENKEGLLELFFRAELLMHRLEVIRFREYGPMGSPHRGQGRVLSILKMQPEISQKQLAYLLDMRNQSLGELLVKLEKSGMITRTPSQEDKRAMIIRLTEAGVAASQEADDSRSSSEKVFESLSDTERENLRATLKKLIDWIDKRLEGEPDATQTYFNAFSSPYFGMNPFVGTPYWNPAATNAALPEAEEDKGEDE